MLSTLEHLVEKLKKKTSPGTSFLNCLSTPQPWNGRDLLLIFLIVYLIIVTYLILASDDESDIRIFHLELNNEFIQNNGTLRHTYHKTGSSALIKKNNNRQYLEC